MKEERENLKYCHFGWLRNNDSERSWLSWLSSETLSGLYVMSEK